MAAKRTLEQNIDVTEVAFMNIRDSIVKKNIEVPEGTPVTDFYKKVDAIEIPTPVLQEKSVSIAENGQVEITPDAGYDGLSKVIADVNAQGGDSMTILAPTKDVIAPFNLLKGQVFYERYFRKKENPAVLPANIGRDCGFSPDGKMLVIPHAGTPYITIYDMTGEIPVKMSNPSILPSSTSYGCSFSPDGSKLAVAHSVSPFVTIYDMTSGKPVKMSDPDELPTGTGNGCAFSPDGKMLAVAHESTPYITIYDMTGEIPVKMSNPSTLPTNTGRGCAFSPDGEILAVAHLTSPFITIYDMTGEMPVKMSYPDELPTGAGYGCTFSTDGKMLVVVQGGSPTIVLYSVLNKTVSRMPNVFKPTTGTTGYGCAFSPDDKILAIAHNSSLFMSIYSSPEFTDTPPGVDGVVSIRVALSDAEKGDVVDVSTISVL